MILRRCSERRNWQELIQAEGLMWGTGDAGRYWDESHYYEFSLVEVDAIEASTEELHEMCIKAAGYVIDNRLYDKLAIPPVGVPLIERSWNAEPPSLYGRFDLAIREGEIKMLEYNADTPTGLVEAAVIQWSWFEQTKLGSDQFNSIDDRLIEVWKYFSDWINGPISFTGCDNVEDGFTLAYLQETANQAGYETIQFPIKELGWDGSEFVAGNSNDFISTLFKLYPWEWLVREAFAPNLEKSTATWMEPAWKMLLSNKGILPILWHLFPGHRLLLEASADKPTDTSGWIRKPILGREGYNVKLYGRAETPGEYGAEGYVYQRDANIQNQEGKYAVVGSWIIGQKASGIGVRESDGPITDNLSRFVPHVIA